MELYDELQQVDKVSEFIIAYDFEVYDIYSSINFFKNNRFILPTTIALYLSAIYFGKKWMKDRPAYKLTLPLFFWNLSLSIFSIVCTVRGIPEGLFYLSKPDGMYSAVCIGLPHNYATSFWGLVFLLSKFLELGDTAFIILRKQKLITLHWFHHAATLSIFWMGYEYYETAGRLAFINAFVHSFMYFYYALKALKVKIPKKASQALTTLQIAQLAFGVYMGFFMLHLMARGRPCRMHVETIILGGSVIAIFLVLFIQFYRDSYSVVVKHKKQ
ncbi:unnamed protein product [Allacma fusca]|uniref:Elongation of very long chain fatty acids protein n=1 Tax=Allacma fusca TaxID=39272 RepID=A0A8J2P2Z1_9HEXA|nr:unnamed protein product [Allacma fusca]